MQKLRPLLLKLLALSAVFAAIGSFCLTLLAVIYASFTVLAVNFELLPYALFFGGVYASGCALSWFLSLPGGLLKPLSGLLAQPGNEQRFIFRAARGLSLLLLIPIAVFAWRFQGAVLGVAIIQTVLSAVIYIFAVRSGPDVFDDILTPAMTAAGIILLLVSGIFSWMWTPGMLSFIPPPACFFLFAALMASNQSSIDRTLFDRKRVSSALPKNIRRMNITLVLSVTAFALFLYAARGLYTSGVMWVLDFIKRLLGYVISFIMWLSSLGAPKEELRIDNLPNETPPPSFEDANLFQSNLVWDAAVYVIGLLVLIYVLNKLIRVGFPAVRNAFRRLSALIVRFLDRQSADIHEENGFTDTYEELESGERRKKRGFIRPQAIGPRLSGLSDIEDLSEKLRYVYKLTLHALSRKHDIRPSDTTGIIFNKTREPETSGELSDITAMYENVRYGGIIPKKEDIRLIKGKYITLKKLTKGRR